MSELYCISSYLKWQISNYRGGLFEITNEIPQGTV